MHVSLVTQPLTDSPTAAMVIAALAADAEVERIDIAVAWAKRSGVGQVAENLRSFTARGGILRIVTGISQGGATRQGLELVAELATEAYVVHHVGRTFHTKVYAGYGAERATLLVGSHNLTLGGLVNNFEVGALLEADRSTASDEAVVRQFQDYIDTLIGDEATRGLTRGALDQLISDPRYQVGDEDVTQRASARAANLTGEGESSIFGPSALDLRRAAGSRPGLGSAPTTRRMPIGNLASSPATVVRRWYKRVPASSVSRLGGNTNPQGHLTLTQGPGIPGQQPHPIGQSTYFRRVFFGDAAWSQGRRATTEVATVVVEVIARGTNLGRFDLVVEHNTLFESGQGNRSSFLHWGSTLSEYLRKRVDHTGDIGLFPDECGVSATR